MKTLDDYITFEDTKEHRSLFEKASYSERLRHFFRLRDLSINKDDYPKGKIFKIYRSNDDLKN